MQWEYSVVTASIANLIQKLSDAGTFEWELVTVIHAGDQRILYFKRPY